jgi:endonuclease YncB( thermonuclease family)
MERYVEHHTARVPFPGEEMKRLILLTTTIALLLALTTTSFANQRTIAKVHAGNLVELEGGWQSWLVGITTPALDTPAGQKALEFTRSQVLGKRVTFSTWTTDNTAAGIVKDESGIAYCTVEFGTPRVDIGAMLIEKGLATVDKEHLPDYAMHYVGLQKKAMAEQVGIWSASTPPTPQKKYRKAQ